MRVGDIVKKITNSMNSLIRDFEISKTESQTSVVKMHTTKRTFEEIATHVIDLVEKNTVITGAVNTQQESVTTIESGVEMLNTITHETEYQSNELESINNSVVYLVDELDKITQKFKV